MGKLTQAGIQSTYSNTGGTTQSFIVPDNTAKHEAAKVQAEVEQRRLDLEEQKRIEERADQLRNEGRTKHAFFVEHGKTIGLIIVILTIGIITFFVMFNSNSNDKLDSELTRKDDQIQVLIHNGKTDEAEKLIGELQHDSHSQSQHKSGTMNFYSYSDYWTMRREELRKMISMSNNKTNEITNPVIDKKKPDEVVVSQHTIPDVPIETNESELSNRTKIVNVAKAYFYNEPNPDTKRKGYLIKGQEVSFTKTEGDFIFCSYTNEEGKTTSGWMLISDIK